MKPAASVSAVLVFCTAILFAQQKAPQDSTNTGKEKLPDPSSLGVLGTDQQEPKADSTKKDTVKKEELPGPQLPAMELRQQALPKPEKMGQPMEKKIKMPLKRRKKAPADTSSAHKALEAKNRALFEQLFGDTPREKKLISKDMASKGKAIHNEHRSHKAIHDAVYSYIESIKLCYRRRLEVNPDLRGEMMFTFIVEWSGKVSDVQLAKTNMGDTRLSKCVLSRIKGWKFKAIPEQEGDVSVAYPIRFHP